MSKVVVNKLHTLSGHSDCIYTLAPIDSRHFMSSGSDGMVVIWDLDNPEEGRLIAKIPTSVYCLAYDKNNHQAVIGQNHEGIHIIDVTARKEINSLKLTETYLFDIQIVGDIILVASGEGTVFVIDKVRNVILKKIKATEESARSISVSSGNNEFAVGYSDNKIRVFDLANYQLKRTIDAHKNSVFTVKYSPNEQFLMSGSRDAHLKVWEVSENYSLKESIVAHMYAINNLDFSPNGKHFVTCSMDKSIKVWDAESLRLLKVIDKARHAGHGTSVNKLYWSNHQNQLISCSDDRTISIWDLNFTD